MDVLIPNLGDIDEVEVIEICVEVGDEVSEGDSLVVIESDKASMDVPADASGVVKEICVSMGDMVSEGSKIVVLESADGGDEESADNADQDKDEGEDKDKGKDQDQDQAQDKAEDEGDADEEPAEKENKSSEQDEAVDDEEGEEKESAQDKASESSGDTGSSGGEEREVLVPDVGEASGVVVIEIAVAAGDVVAKDDLLIVLESDKASMEITAEFAGEILEVLVKEEQEVEEGTPIVKIRTEAEAGDADAQPEAEEGKADKGEKSEKKEESGKKEKDEKKEKDRSSEPEASAEKSTPASAGDKNVYAGPATRRLARELGVDLSRVKGTGQRDRILKEDVKAFVKDKLTGEQPASGDVGWPTIPEVDFAKFGEVELADLSRIRQRGAQNLHRSWVNLPHVTQHDEVDVTDLEDFRASLKKQAEQKGVRVTPLAFIVKACCAALREYPEFNSSLSADGKQLIIKKYINIGMAVDTPEGLVVPVIRNAADKDIWTLSEEIVSLSEKARDKKLAMDDLQGGSFSVSSLGALGGTGFTPIVNAPEVAILGVSKLSTKPVWSGEAFEPRKVLPLSLSYDHRVINGADGGRFMMRLVELLGDVRQFALT